MLSCVVCVIGGEKPLNGVILTSQIEKVKAVVVVVVVAVVKKMKAKFY